MRFTYGIARSQFLLEWSELERTKHFQKSGEGFQVSLRIANADDVV